jgi:hypothetical protein
MCGTPNQVESVFCAKCGARLVPLTAAAAPEQTSAPPIKGLSLPTKPPAPTEPEPPVTAGEPATDWLARLRATPSIEEVEPTAPAEEEPHITEPMVEERVEIPEWLARLRSTPPAVEEAPAAEPSQPAEPELAPEPITEPRPTLPSEPVEGVPDWLKPSAIAPASPAMEQPSWLKTETPTAEEPVALKRLQPTPLTPAVAPTPAAEEGIPDWLRILRPEPSVAGEPQAGKIEKIPPTEPVRAPQVTAPPVPAAKERAVPTRAAEEPIPFEDEEIPDWLRFAKPTEKVEPVAEAPSAPAPLVIEPVPPEEVPAWIAALKPSAVVESVMPVGAEGETVESSGPLAGLRGVLPLAAAAAEPHALTKSPIVGDRREGARLFESILATPAAEVTAPAAPKKRIVWTMCPLIYLLLALAVVIPFLIPFNLVGSTLRISSGTPAAEFYEMVEVLPANSTVVLSFDYDPSLSGEMDLQAKAIVRHLISRRVKIIALSTLETGPQIARRILDPAARAASNYVYGTDYVNLGYVAGHEAGLARLATSGFSTNDKDFVWQQPFGSFQIAQNVNVLRNIPLVVVFAGSEESLKMWLEQARTRTAVRMAAGVSAAVEPKARAYRDANQLAALVSGLMGAAQYEILSNQPGLAVISVNAQSAAQLILVFIVILGNIVFWISRARGKAK